MSVTKSKETDDKMDRDNWFQQLEARRLQTLNNQQNEPQDTEKNYNVTKDSDASEYFAHFERLIDSPRYSDCALTCSGVRFFLHKIVLAARCSKLLQKIESAELERGEPYELDAALHTPHELTQFLKVLYACHNQTQVLYEARHLLREFPIDGGEPELSATGNPPPPFPVSSTPRRPPSSSLSHPLPHSLSESSPPRRRRYHPINIFESILSEQHDSPGLATELSNVENKPPYDDDYDGGRQASVEQSGTDQIAATAERAKEAEKPSVIDLTDDVSGDDAARFNNERVAHISSTSAGGNDLFALPIDDVVGGSEAFITNPEHDAAFTDSGGGSDGAKNSASIVEAALVDNDSGPDELIDLASASDDDVMAGHLPPVTTNDRADERLNVNASTSEALDTTGCTSMNETMLNVTAMDSFQVLEKGAQFGLKTTLGKRKMREKLREVRNFKKLKVSWKTPLFVKNVYEDTELDASIPSPEMIDNFLIDSVSSRSSPAFATSPTLISAAASSSTFSKPLVLPLQTSGPVHKVSAVTVDSQEKSETAKKPENVFSQSSRGDAKRKKLIGRRPSDEQSQSASTSTNLDQAVSSQQRNGGDKLIKLTTIEQCADHLRTVLCKKESETLRKVLQHEPISMLVVKKLLTEGGYKCSDDILKKALDSQNVTITPVPEDAADGTTTSAPRRQGARGRGRPRKKGRAK